MDPGIGNNNFPRQERGRGGGIGPDRRIKRGARNMTLKGGERGGEAGGKFRNRTWRRDDAATQGDLQQESQSDTEDRGAQLASQPLFGVSNVPLFFGAAGGINGFTQASQMDGGSPAASGNGSSGFNASGSSTFGQSAFPPTTSTFSTTPVSSPPKRNAFGALIDAESGQPISAFAQLTPGQLQPQNSTFGTFPPPPSTFASPSPFGTTAAPVSAFQPPKGVGLNAAAPEFKPGSASARPTTVFGATSTLSQAGSSTTPGSASTPSPFGITQSAFSTSQPFSAPQNVLTPPKSVFATSGFDSPRSSPNGTLSSTQGNVFTPPKREPGQMASISASAREGEHIPTSRLQFKNRPRWKTHEGSPTPPIPVKLPPKNVPPYRVPPNIQREIDQGHYATDNRFPGNRFLELKALRPSMRVHSIKHKLISDPEHRTDLTGAITVVGTCMDMCPEFERHEREFQKDVDDWEKIPGTNPKRIDHAKAVKKYRRSAAGNDEPLESDLRPAGVLKMTLDYLFYELLDKHGLEATYAFIRDRTRAIRTDFTIQHEKGPIAIECFERIARFHILAVHRFCERDDVRGFDYWQEVEQMMKTLQSLIQFYDDNEGKLDSPNEAEFRSYYILAHIRDTNSMRRIQALAPQIFLDPVLQTAIEFRSYAQRNTHVERHSSHRAAKLKFRNSEACQNAFTRFFKRVKNEGTSYLMACLLEYHFGGVRKGAVHALWKAYTTRHRPLPTSDLMEMLGVDDEEKTLEVARRFGMVSVAESGEAGGTAAVQLNKLSKFDYSNQMAQRHSVTLVEMKRGDLSDVDIVDGRFRKADETWRFSPSEDAVSMPVQPEPAEFSNNNMRRASIKKDAVPRSPSIPITFPPTVGQSSTSSIPSPTNWNAFSHQATAQKAFAVNATPIFQVPNSSTAGLVPPTFMSPTNPSPVPAATVSPLPSPTPPATVLSSGVYLPPRTESVFTPPTQTPQDLPSPIPQQEPSAEVHSHVRSPPVFAQTPGLPPPNIGASADEPLPAAPEAPSPPRPTQEELLYEQKQALQRASALAQAKADRHFKFQVLFKIFTHWKRNVMNRGHVRATREDQEAQFRRSIRDMGLSTNSPASDRKGKHKAVYPEEDLVAWEDTSQASSSTGTRRRPRKVMKRADDDATIAAIKEAEATRIKLWEERTFLSSVIQHIQEQLPDPGITLPAGWQIWLSTTADNASTAGWLRVKFGVVPSKTSTVTPGLDKISLSNDGALPTGHTYSAGLIVFDCSTATDESTVQSEGQRLLSIISSLPPDRHYIPSVILLQWNEAVDLPSHILSLLDNFQRDNTINSWRILSFLNNGRHFDDQFLSGIKELPLDTVGKLMETTSINAVYQKFFPHWDTALDRGISICQLSQSGDFDWALYGKVMTTMVNYINRLAEEVLRICKVESSLQPLPPFAESSVFDQHTAFEAFMSYLNTGWLASNQDAALLRIELSSDSSAGREFYIRAVPERLAHLMLCKIQTSVPSNRHFFWDVKNSPSSVALFNESIHAALTQVERRFPTSPSKKRLASHEVVYTSSSLQSDVPEAKRRKHDCSSGVINDNPRPSMNGHSPKQDPLARLKATVAKARRSVEDLRLSRDFDRSLSPPEYESDVWDLTHDSFSPELPSRESPTRSEWKSNSHTPYPFTRQPDIDLPLIPRDAFEVITAKPANVLALSPQHQSSPYVSAKAKSNGAHPRFNSYLEGRARILPFTRSAPSPTRVRHGAASLTPRPPELEIESVSGNLEKLKDNLRRAERAVELSRRARETHEGL